MRRQMTPSHLKPFPQRQFLADNTLLVNHYAGFEKAIPAIPAIPALPGFKTSAAFLTSLSANLQIDPDLPSPLGTPTTFRHTTASLRPLPPTSLTFSTLPPPPDPYPPSTDLNTMSSTDPPPPLKSPTEQLPQLSTYTADSEDDRIDGLRLVADSVAQQRQVSSKMLIFHPIILSAFALISAIATQWVMKKYNEWLVVGTTVGGIAMTFLIFIRWMTGPYISIAEDIDTTWLGDDRMLVVKWGEEIIGALVLGWADSDATKKRGRRRRGKALVRAWTVRLKYRGKGVGESLLEEAVKVAGEKGADGILFDANHANSYRVLPAIFNGFLNKQEARAEKALKKVADEKGNFRQRQSSPTWGSR